MLTPKFYQQSGAIAAFFMQATVAFASSQVQPDNHVLSTLANSTVWQALLHSEQGRTNISDPSFTLSLPHFSPLTELKSTLDLLQADPTAVCRFPARYWWLKQQLTIPDLPLDSCPDVITFRQKAPMQMLSLVFVSESISQPSSIMGHAFLKMSGHDGQGKQQEHAISFYTDAETINLPKLLFESLIIGKEGYFALSPYQEQQKRYTDIEGRNIWEYDLALDSWQLELIRLHLLELKQTQLRYYFQDYNCATLVRFIMALSGQLPTRGFSWVSPKDLVRSAQAAGLITRQRTITSSRWLTFTLEQQLPLTRQWSNMQALTYGDINSTEYPTDEPQAFIALMHAQALNQHYYMQGKIDTNRQERNYAALDSIRQQKFTGLSLSSDPQLDPSTSPPDSQVSTQWQKRQGQDALSLSLIPASHQLDDDNQSYQHENGLQLLQPTLLLPLNGSHPRLDSFRLYSMQSLLPYRVNTGGLSSKLEIAYTPQYGSRLQLGRALTLGGLLGITLRPHSDIDTYALAGGAMAWRAGQANLQADAEVGLIIRGVFNSKIQLAHSWHHNQLASGSSYKKLKASFNWYLSKKHTLSTNASWYYQNDLLQLQPEFSYRYLF